MAANLNDLKKQVFYELLNLAGRVFIQTRHSKKVIIGNRGFLPEEKEKGIVLVFNRQMNFGWDDDGISATLVFGSNKEKCFIPADEILSIFSPELNAQFWVSPQGEKVQDTKADKKGAEKPEKGKKIIKVDFNKKK